ncbi:MAG: methyltransferase domain-containing protein [Candidatus Dojkabacteria bacterium]|nr:methyltransferase domain-containing protein [Candidatus Dojkabacteria bacterium]
MHRKEKILYSVNKNGLILEIGPSYNPIVPKKEGYNAHILDHASREELINKYKSHNVPIENIEEVDYVWNGENYTDLIGKTKLYDAIIASHVIEHVPDFIHFLNQCEALLKDEGVLSLAVPDMRYCFDYFAPYSSTGSIIDAHMHRLTKPSPGMVFTSMSNASIRNGKLAWFPEDSTGPDAVLHTFDTLKDHLKKAQEGEYIDVHCWRFTPSSFKLIMYDLFNLGYTNFVIKNEFDTVEFEFFVTLGIDKNKKHIEFDRYSLLRKISKEIGEAYNPQN